MFYGRTFLTLIGALVGTGLLFGLVGMLLYLERNGFKTYPGKGESRYKRRGRIKAEKKLNQRRFRF